MTAQKPGGASGEDGARDGGSADNGTADDGALRFGLLTGVGAYILWGVFPFYFHLLEAAGAFEILASRIFWAVPFGALVLTVRRQWRETRLAFSDRKILRQLLISALFIAANWGVYVWAVLHERILEASLGYYINPLIYVAAGVFILGEKLRRAQIIAIILAAIGVLILTIGNGVFPLISIVLAVSFTVYGLVRKTTNVGAMPGLFVETSILAPAALGFLVFQGVHGSLAFGGDNLPLSAALISTGPITILPLVLFALSARRLRLSTLGILQYIGPTIQLGIAVLLGEIFTVYHAICFGFIWLALVIYSADSLKARRASRPAPTRAALTD